MKHEIYDGILPNKIKIIVEILIYNVLNISI